MQSSMKKITSYNVVFMFIGVVLMIVGSGSTTVLAGEKQPSMARFIQIRWPGSVHIAPDQTLYFIHRADGINQLYKVEPGKSQKDAVQLTRFPDGIGGYRLSEDGRWIVITASVGGSEQADLFLMDTATNQLKTLFENPDVVYGNVVWRRDSKAFAYRANDESRSDFHIYLYDLVTRSPKKVLAGKGAYASVDFNRDGTRLMVSKSHSSSYTQLFEVNLTTGDSREITPAQEKWAFRGVGYTADDRHFLVNTDYHGDLRAIHSMNLRTGKLSPVLSDLTGQEVEFATFNKDRTVLAVAVNEEGYRTLHLRKALDYSPIPTPPIDKGIVGNIRFSGNHLLYSLNNARTPGIVYRWDMTTPSASPVPLTTADTQGIDVSRFRLPQLVHYPSFDGQKIPAFLYLPPGYRTGQKIPFIVKYHGGPAGQNRPSFNRAYQYFLSRGYGIMTPNVRGSSGYGRAYLEADNYKKRHFSVKDGIWAARYVIDQGYTEKRKVAAWGGSYGGFMVMAAITEAPELFGAACDVVGIVDFETFLAKTKSYRRHLREAEYGPLTDPAFLRSISPLHKVDRIQAPLMLAHGLNDPRVPIGESMQVAVALKRRGVDVEELYFPDEGHGFKKEANQLLYYKQLAKFFDKHLRNH